MREQSSTGRDRGGVYKTVVIDPPWPIAGLLREQRIEKLNQDRTPRKPIYQRYKWLCQYHLMTMNDIELFPINDFAAKDALLFIWVTNGKAEGISIISFAISLLEQWGFSYHSFITWYKKQGMASHSPIRTATEHIILGWRGNFHNLTRHNMAAMDSLFETSYQTRAGEKPAKFYQMLRRWTPKPRIDLFARRAHEGFDGWGDEYVGDGPLQEFLQ